MLENDFVGHRSGTSPLRGFVVSQNQSNVRRWRVSRNADSAGDETYLILPPTAGAVALLHATAESADSDVRTANVPARIVSRRRGTAPDLRRIVITGSLRGVDPRPAVGAAEAVAQPELQPTSETRTLRLAVPLLPRRIGRL